MEQRTHRSSYLSEAVRQVEGALRLRMVKEQLCTHAPKGRLSEEIANLMSRIDTAHTLWSNPAWMNGVEEVIDFFANQWKTSVPPLVEFYQNQIDSDEPQDLIDFANLFCAKHGHTTTGLAKANPRATSERNNAAVCWLHQAQALAIWKQLAQDLGTLAVRNDLCEDLSQLKVAVEHYNNSANEQIRAEERLPPLLRNKRALRILDSIATVTVNVRKALSQIEIRSLKGSSSPVFRAGENGLTMNSLLNEPDCPSRVMFELIKDKDESFWELFGDGKQLADFCIELSSELHSEGGTVELSQLPLVDLTNRATLICALIRRFDAISTGTTPPTPRRAKLANSIVNLACTLLCPYQAEVKLIYEPAPGQHSIDFDIENVDFDQPAAVVATGLELLLNHHRHLILKPKVRLPIKLHALFASLHETANALQEFRPGSNACSAFADRIRQHKIRADIQSTLHEQASASGWLTFNRDLVDLVRELELVQGRSLPQLLKLQVDEAFHILKSEGYVVERNLAEHSETAPWEFQVLPAATADELPSGRIVTRRLTSIDDTQLDNCLCLQVAREAGNRPLGMFLSRNEQDFFGLQHDDPDWMPQHLTSFLHDVKAALHSPPDAEIKVAVDFFGKLFDRSQRDPFRVRYRAICSSLLKTILSELNYQVAPSVDPESLAVEQVTSALKNRLNVQWQYDKGQHGQVLEVLQFSSPLDQGAVTASLGSQFPNRLRQLLALEQAGAELKIPSKFAEFQRWLHNLERFYWDPESFESEWNEFRSQIVELANKTKAQNSQLPDAWADEWIKLALAAPPDSATRTIFSIIYEQEEWFTAYPNIDAQSLTPYWPDNVSTAISGVRILPGGTLGEVQSVQTFGLRPARAKVTLLGGSESLDLLTACDEMHAIVKDLGQKLGRPIVSLLAAARDPFVAPNAPQKSTQEFLDKSLNTLLEMVLDKELDAQKADVVLERLLIVARQLGYVNSTWNWSFIADSFDSVELSSVDLAYQFSVQPAGKINLHHFEVSESPKAVTVALSRSAGPAPPGFEQLVSLLDSLNFQSTTFVESLRLALDALQMEVAMGQVTLQEQRIAEIWDTITLELTDQLNREPAAERLDLETQFMDAVLKLVEFFGLEAFGKAGTYMSAIATNTDYEVWFEFDHAELSRRAGSMEGAIDRIRTVERPGLRRRNALTPLRRAIVGL